MNASNPTCTPLPAGTVLLPSDSSVAENDPQFISKYQSLIGSLMYAMLGTHPDLAFAILKLSRFSSNPTEQHLKAAKHMLRYLRRTSTLKLHYGSDGDVIPHAYSDSDWGSDKDRRYSITGYVFMLAG